MTSLADQFEALATKIRALLAGMEAHPDEARDIHEEMGIILAAHTKTILAALRSAPPVQEGWRGIETAGIRALVEEFGARAADWGYAAESPGSDAELQSKHAMECARDNLIAAIDRSPLPAAPEPTPTGEMG